MKPLQCEMLSHWNCTGKRQQRAIIIIIVPLLFCSQSSVRVPSFQLRIFMRTFLVGCIPTTTAATTITMKKHVFLFLAFLHFVIMLLVFFHSDAAFLCLSNLLWIGHSPSYNRIRVECVFFRVSEYRRSKCVPKKKCCGDENSSLSYTLRNQMSSNRTHTPKVMNWLANNY